MAINQPQTTQYTVPYETNLFACGTASGMKSKATCAMAAILTTAAARVVPSVAFMPIRRSLFLQMTNALQKCPQSSLLAVDTRKECEVTKKYNLSPQIFVEEVATFLDSDDIPWRDFSRQELRRTLELHFEQNSLSSASTSKSDRVNEMMALLEDRVILAVGSGGRNNNTQIEKTNNGTGSDGASD